MAGTMFELETDLGRRRSKVAVGLDILSRVGSLLRECDPGATGRQAGLVTDSRVGPLYGDVVRESLRAAGFELFVHQVPVGETSKAFAVAQALYQVLADHHVGRDGILIALGGGVVSDLTGFAAGTWMRGIRFAILPTTLEADVDASIGGKTAVNLPAGKNLVGVFHQPFLVAIDPKCLSTLDARDVRAGLAESIKHALITSEEFLAWHEDRAGAILSLHEETMAELIRTNVQVKAGIVERDALEQTHTRMLLNFGHTIGHAIESCSDYSLRHGECVALGMLAACRLSVELGWLGVAVAERVEALLGRLGLPTVMPTPIEAVRITESIRCDKKARGGKAQFVVLEGVGRPVVRDDIPEALVAEAYESLLP